MARDTNFYYSFLVLPAPKRQAILAVWDFCRAVDDAVDEVPAGAPPGAAQAALEFWRAEVARCFEGAPSASPEGRALQPMTRRFPLPRRPFEELIDGVSMDVGATRYATFDDLRRYCYLVASTVGLMCVEIFGYRNPRAREYAVELGVALQLTNILRDVPRDLERGRLYVPLEDLARAGCTEDELRMGRLTPGVIALLRQQGDRARLYFARARAALPREDRVSLVAAEIMAAIYEAILARIERRGYDVFSEPVRVPRSRRALIAAWTWARVVSGLR
jgi:phytoene synthase